MPPPRNDLEAGEAEPLSGDGQPMFVLFYMQI